MRIVMLSDTHNLHEDVLVPDGDLVLFAGDMSEDGTFRECADFIYWFKNLPHRHKIIVAGNHDYIFLTEYKRVLMGLMEDCHYLENSGVEIGGLSFYGSPNTPFYGNMAFNVGRGEAIRNVWATIPDSVDVLVTHGPMYGVLDMNYAGLHVGCEELRQRIEDVSFSMHVCGHIHESYGHVEHNGVHLVNAALTSLGAVVNEPVVVDLGA
jgi:Icc-related predicted phosphoesterase